MKEKFFVQSVLYSDEDRKKLHVELKKKGWKSTGDLLRAFVIAPKKIPNASEFPRA